MKKIITIAILLLIGGFFVFNYNVKPRDIDLARVAEISNDNVFVSGSNLESDLEKKLEFIDFDFQFTGYGPAGRFHTGVIESKIVSGNEIIFEMTTVKTDGGNNQRLDNHLCEDDFFGCDRFPNSVFTLKSITPLDLNTYGVSGAFRLKDIEKNVYFEANTIDSTEALSNSNSYSEYQASFLLDTTEFGFRVPIVEPEALIELSFKVRQTIVEAEDEL